jgi:pseudouridine 5'-phosphatase
MPASNPASPVFVLFDLDGVLLDTEDLYTQATQTIVGRYGKTYDWSLKRHLLGRDALLGASNLMRLLEIPLTGQEYLALQRPILEDLFKRSPAMPGAEAFVRRLAAEGISMAVGTSTERKLYDLKVLPHDWFSLFRAVVCGDDPSVGARKPAPDIFLAAARALRADAERCVVIEDSPAGVQAGLAAGMRVIAMPHPAVGAEACAGAHRIVSGWSEISASDLGF